MRFLLLLLAVGTYTQDAQRWRADREERLKAPNGWLSVSGLYWLKDGTNALPFGKFELKKGVVSFKGKVLRANSEDTAKSGEKTLAAIERGGRLGIRERDPNAETRKHFTGLKWYPIQEKWRVKAKWVPYPAGHTIKILNILGMVSDEPSPGYAEFKVNGQTVRLDPVDEKESYAFLFKDATSGKATYAPGRFLDTDPPKNGMIELDFNLAYNPPCAFTAYATCPLPPKQNRLAVAIEAGEKKYHP